MLIRHFLRVSKFTRNTAKARKLEHGRPPTPNQTLCYASAQTKERSRTRTRINHPTSMFQLFGVYCIVTSTSISWSLSPYATRGYLADSVITCKLHPWEALLQDIRSISSDPVAWRDEPLQDLEGGLFVEPHQVGFPLTRIGLCFLFSRPLVY